MNKIKLKNKNNIKILKKTINSVNAFKKIDLETNVTNQNQYDYGSDKIKKTFSILTSGILRPNKIKSIKKFDKIKLSRYFNNNTLNNVTSKKIKKMLSFFNNNYLKNGHLLQKIFKSFNFLIKNILSKFKSLATVIAAGGFLSFIIILVISLIALLSSSIFGIFFSSKIKI